MRSIKFVQHNDEYDSYYSFSDMNDGFGHYNVKGSHWGDRKYQYKDGSLTPLGRIHYGVGKARDAAAKYANKAKRAIKSFDDKMTEDMKDVDRVVDKVSDKMANIFDENRRAENKAKKEIEKRKETAKKEVEKRLYSTKHDDVLDNSSYSHYLDLLQTTGSRKKAAEEIVKNMIRADVNKELSRKEFINSVFKNEKLPSAKKHLAEIESLVNERYKEEKYQDMVDYLKTDYSKENDRLNYDQTGVQTVLRKYIDPDNDTINSSGYRHDHKPIEYMGKYYKNMRDLEISQPKHYFDENGKRVDLPVNDLSIDPKKKNDDVFGGLRVKRPTYTKETAVEEVKELSKLMEKYWNEKHDSEKVSKKDSDLEKRQIAADRMFMAHPEYYINEYGLLEYKGQIYNNVASLLDDMSDDFKKHKPNY